MKIKLLTVGKIKEKFYQSAIKEFEKRLSSYATLEIVEVPDQPTKQEMSTEEERILREKEGKELLKKCKDSDYVIALDMRGKSLTSEKLAEKIQQLQFTYSSLTFIIGGSIGLSKEVVNRADYTLSFSQFTFPHQLMRVILLEQIYRSFRIIHNHPYHK